MSNVNVNIHICQDTEIKIGSPLAAHAWITVGDLTLFMGHSFEEGLYNIDRLSDALLQLRQQRVELQELTENPTAAWKKSEAGRM